LDTTLQTISFLVIVLALVSVALASAVVINQRRRARRQGIAEANVLPLRAIGAYEDMPRLVGQAVEADRPILISTGASSIGDESTVVTLAALSLAYYTTRQASVGQTSPILLTNQALLVPLGADMLRRAYVASGQPVRTDMTSVRWYGTLQEQSLVFAAMLAVTMRADDTAGAVLLGDFGSEIGLALGAAQRQSAITIAGSSDVIGQAVAYGMAENSLFGEDIFSPAGYLGGSVGERGSLLAQDFLRGVLITGIIVVAVVEVAGEQVAGLLAPLFGLFGG